MCTSLASFATPMSDSEYSYDEDEIEYFGLHEVVRKPSELVPSAHTTGQVDDIPSTATLLAVSNTFGLVFVATPQGTLHPHTSSHTLPHTRPHTHVHTHTYTHTHTHTHTHTYTRSVAH